MRPEYITVGTAVNAHGIRGEVKVNPVGFDPEFIAAFKTLYIGGKPMAVKAALPGPQGLRGAGRWPRVPDPRRPKRVYRRCER